MVGISVYSGYRLRFDDHIMSSEPLIETVQYDIRDLLVNFENEEEYWSAYYQGVEDLYEDVLMGEDQNDEDGDVTGSEPPMATPTNMSTPIFDGSLTTLGVSLYSIVSFAVKNSLR